MDCDIEEIMDLMVSKVKVNYDLKFIYFDNGNGWDYEIPFSELKTNRDVANWAAHLAEKTWVSTELIVDIFRSVQSLIDDGVI